MLRCCCRYCLACVGKNTTVSLRDVQLHHTVTHVPVLKWAKVMRVCSANTLEVAAHARCSAGYSLFIIKMRGVCVASHGKDAAMAGIAHDFVRTRALMKVVKLTRVGHAECGTLIAVVHLDGRSLADMLLQQRLATLDVTEPENWDAYYAHGEVSRDRDAIVGTAQFA